MQKLLFVLVATVTIGAHAGGNCPTKNLGEFLNCEDPRVKTFIRALEAKPNKQPLSGYRLSDGSTLFTKWRYLGKARDMKHGQHVFLFSHGKDLRVVAWVDKGGVSLRIPTCPKGADCSAEGQYVLSFDVYTYSSIQPGDGPVILFYPKRSWFKQ